MTDDPSRGASGPRARALQQTALQQTLSRRRLLGLAGATGVAGVSLAACSSGNTVVQSAADMSSGPPFVSRPDLTPPQISIRRHGVPSNPRYMFLNAPYSGPGHGGAYILDHRGHFVWFGPNTAAHHHMNFDVQTYQGKPVLTWFQGLVVQGYGKGELIIADSSYKIKHVIRPPGGELADFHDFYVTPQGTAFITVYRTHSGIDLTGYRGPQNGYVLSGVAQEIDIATGKLLWEWDSINHVPLQESHEHLSPGEGTKGQPYNYFHINSFSPTGDSSGDVLISGRNTWAIYRVKRNTAGTVVWRMNGKRSHFSMGPGSHFYWQHHVRAFSGNRITVFDNGARHGKHSRAIILHVEYERRHVALEKAYIHPGVAVLASAMGSAQLLADGGMFVGWGTKPYFSEFAHDGRLLLDGTITVGDQSYRAFTHEWAGHPTEPPAVAARHRSGGGAVVYASWNGATNVATWRVFAGTSRSALHQVGSGRRSGFETAIAVRSKGPYFAVQAHDAKGTLLAKSAAVKIS
jgi:arylsulfotransferase ASST